jgi:hypothetical protein
MDEMPQSEVRPEKEQDGQICLNCRQELTGRFCSSCGQDSRPFKRSLGSILSGAAEGLFDLDGKILKSIIPILTSPGKLTLAYLDGKRRAQVNPFQLYAFFSFLFFFTSIYMPSFLEKELDTGKLKDVPEFLGDSVSREDSVTIDFFDERLEFSAGDSVRKPHKLASYDSVQAVLPESRRDGLIKNLLTRRFYNIVDRAQSEGTTIFHEVVQNFKDNIPNTLIFLLPFFALLLKLFYLRRNFFFVDHLIFSIHQFCFLFLVGTIFFILNPILTEDVVYWIFVGLILYFLIAMKRVYAQSWIKTILKLFMISVLYSIILAIALSMNVVYALLFQV